ncbi:PAS domain S-box protein [Mucilaginibacter sp.]
METIDKQHTVNTNSRNPAVRLWRTYATFVARTSAESAEEEQSIAYWRDKLFLNFIIYFLPICLVALLPGVYMSLKMGYNAIAATDIGAALAIVAVALNRYLGLLLKKIVVVCILYVLAVVLIVYLGFYGPGLMYLLAISVFVTLTLPGKFAYWSIVLNVLVCVYFGIIIDTKLFQSPLINEYSLGNWVAISSNVLLLSWVNVLLIRYFIDGLEVTFAKKRQLREQLQQAAVSAASGRLRLQESEGQYESLFSLSPSPMLVMDRKNFRFLQVNEAALKEYGYTENEFLALSVDDIKLPEEMGAFHDLLKKSRSIGGSRDAVTHRRKNGEQFPVDVIFNTISFKGKAAMLAIPRNITVQQHHIRAIESQNAKLLEIAFIQSHYVRAPLSRIMGLVDLLVATGKQVPDARLLEYLDISARDLDRVIRQINDIAEQLEQTDGA